MPAYEFRPTPAPTPPDPRFAVVPGEYLGSQSSVFSNLTRELDETIAAKLKGTPEVVHAQHAAWDFCGYVWFGKDGYWHEQVWQHHAPIADIVGADVMDVVTEASDTYGWD